MLFYLLVKNLAKNKEATNALRKAFEIRKEYEPLGLLESHDTLQQIANLANILIVGNELGQARELLSLYEPLILEYESTECLDYGFCQTMYGMLYLQEKNLVKAEQHFLSAESIISNVMGTDNDYIKTVYRYLHTLYSRWRKPELTRKYKEKLLAVNLHNLKISS